MQTTAALTVNDLLIKSLNTIRIGTQFNNLSGYDMELALSILNEVLAESNAGGAFVPFFYDVVFELIPFKSKYYFGQGPLADVVCPYFTDVRFINIYYSSLRYPVRIISDVQALGVVNNTTIDFLPACARTYWENGENGETYFVLDFLNMPNQAYTATVRGKPCFQQVALQDYINEFPIYARTYLRMEIAYRLVSFYGNRAAWTEHEDSLWQRSLNNLLSANEISLEVNNNSTLLQKRQLLYTINIGVTGS